jgi:hypothetical protein
VLQEAELLVAGGEYEILPIRLSASLFGAEWGIGENL